MQANLVSLRKEQDALEGALAAAERNVAAEEEELAQRQGEKQQMQARLHE